MTPHAAALVLAGAALVDIVASRAPRPGPPGPDEGGWATALAPAAPGRLARLFAYLTLAAWLAAGAAARPAPTAATRPGVGPAGPPGVRPPAPPPGQVRPRSGDPPR